VKAKKVEEVYQEVDCWLQDNIPEDYEEDINDYQEDDGDEQ